MTIASDDFEVRWANTPGAIIENPGERFRIENQAKAEKTSWVRITIPLPDSTSIQALVYVLSSSGKATVNSIHYPDGRILKIAEQKDWRQRFWRAKQSAATIKQSQPSTQSFLTRVPPPLRGTWQREPVLLVAQPMQRATDSNPNFDWEEDEETVPAAPARGKVGLAVRWTLVAIIILGAFLWGKTSLPASSPTVTGSQNQKLTFTPPSGHTKLSGGKKEDADTDEVPDPNAPKAVTVIHGDLKVTLACEPDNEKISCAGFIDNIGGDEGYFYITGSDYPKHGWAQNQNGDTARIEVNEHFRLGSWDRWNGHCVWMSKKSRTKFWFSYESSNPEAVKTTHIDLDMMWNGDNYLGFDLPEVPINRTTLQALNVSH